VFIETGKIEQALNTLKELTILHPRYEQTHHTFQQLLLKLEIYRKNRPKLSLFQKLTNFYYRELVEI